MVIEIYNHKVIYNLGMRLYILKIVYDLSIWPNFIKYYFQYNFNNIQSFTFLSSNRFIILRFGVSYWSKLLPYYLIIMLVLHSCGRPELLWSAPSWNHSNSSMEKRNMFGSRATGLLKVVTLVMTRRTAS